MSESQHKPTYTAHDFAFGEDGERIAVFINPHDAPSVQLLRTLQEQGVVFPDEREAVEAIEASYSVVGMQRESNSLRNQSPEKKVANWLDRFKRKHHVNTTRTT
jgi:hypothetical protein